MSTITPSRPTVSSPPPSGPPPLHRITVDEYERIIASGALDDAARVELIDGYMVDKMAKSPEHSFSTIETHQALAGRLPAGWSARMEQPVRIPAYDEPEPDISIVRGAKPDDRSRAGIGISSILPGGKERVGNRKQCSCLAESARPDRSTGPVDGRGAVREGGMVRG